MISMTTSVIPTQKRINHIMILPGFILADNKGRVGPLDVTDPPETGRLNLGGRRPVPEPKGQKL